MGFIMIWVLVIEIVNSFSDMLYVNSFYLYIFKQVNPNLESWKKLYLTI